ncbi:hypothetical protein R1sor_021954 [Riccia sorocarpa]|uniref:BPL/LPL catalytic domain-containing protein n=1 Tax=Riccia sorocarpa TaxID=122646 RepID=A0ABD3GJ74_9MARC
MPASNEFLMRRGKEKSLVLTSEEMPACARHGVRSVIMCIRVRAVKCALVRSVIASGSVCVRQIRHQVIQSDFRPMRSRAVAGQLRERLKIGERREHSFAMSGRVVNGARPLMRVLKLSNFPIFQQLKLEERLLRKSSDNWCLVNDGTSPPSIVMGISGKAEKLLEVEKVVKDGVPVIKRFSGGGTVIVDEGTLFITLICCRSALPGLELYPREIMSWTELLYVPVFENVPGFKLREHDYVFNDRKFGGNAQSIIKDRWLHHTSFLWDFRDSRMAYLKLPERAPAYREGRNHTDFICRLREHFPSRDTFMDAVQAGLERHFFLREESLIGVESELGGEPHISSTHFVSVDDLKLSPLL